MNIKDLKIYIGSDHAGFRLKKEIKKYLEEKEIDYQDLGNEDLEMKDDYPDYALKVGKKVAEAGNLGRGILICHSGVGMCIAANKVKGIRAVNGHTEEIAKESRNDEDTNVLCFGQGHKEIEEVKDILRIWFETPFSEAERHSRRVSKVENIENTGFACPVCE